MPELPDIEIYIEALRSRIVDRRLDTVRITSPFLLRSVHPPIDRFFGLTLRSIDRLGKRIVFDFDDERFLILHLMIAGRLHWKKAGASVGGKQRLAAFDFENGTLLLTEAGSKRRASLEALRGQESLADHDRGGLDPIACSLEEFQERLLRSNHTLKRALCDPSCFSGIGNAYSDEVLHAAQLSPFKLSRSLNPDEIRCLHSATRATLELWVRRLRNQAGGGFPEKVTAFRPEMAVHGQYGKPCPVCGSPVQRIVYADNEANYCARCQTGGRVLRDRALSRLLKSDWPRSIDEMEALRGKEAG